MQCELQRIGDELRFFRSDCERRGEKNVIAVETVNATLRGIGEDIFLEGCLANFFGDVFFFGEGFAGGFVFHEFDAEEQTKAADFADVWMGSEWSQHFAESFCGGFDAGKEILLLEEIEHGVSGGCRDGMGLIGEAVLERSGTCCECFRRLAKR